TSWYISESTCLFSRLIFIVTRFPVSRSQNELDLSLRIDRDSLGRSPVFGARVADGLRQHIFKPVCDHRPVVPRGLLARRCLKPLSLGMIVEQLDHVIGKISRIIS